MKRIIPFLCLLILSPVAAEAQSSIRFSSHPAQPDIPLVEAVGAVTPSPAAGPAAVALSYYDPNLPRLSWQYPRNYNSFINLYLMQRFTLPNNTGYLDSVSVWIEDVNQGAIRLRIFADTAINFGTATFRMPDFSRLFDEKIVDKTALKMRAWNTIKMSGSLVPKDFFVTVEFTVSGGSNNLVTILSDSRVAPRRSEQDSRVVMLNQVGSDIQASLMDSLFTYQGNHLFPYLLMTAYADTSTFSDTPVITTTPVTKAYTNVPYTYTVHASGVPRPVYSLLLAPPSLTIDGFSGEINWRPGTADLGSHTISVRASNANGSQDQTYLLQVIQSTPSKITSTPKRLGIANELYTYQVTATGLPVPTFAFASAPAGMTINQTGLINWNPNSSQVGSFNIAVYSKNGVANDTQRYVLRIDATPSAPSFTSTPKTTIVAGQVYTYQPTATGNPQPIYSLTKNPAGMTIDPGTGLVTWSNTTGQEGNHDVTIRAENRVGYKEQSFTLTVTPPPATPVITSSPPTDAVAELSYSYTVTATGTPAPTFSLPVAPSGMTINGTSGIISWTPTRAQKGNNAVTVRATNSAGSNDQQFAILVRTKPVITSNPVTSGEATKPYTYQVIADASPAAAFALVQAPTGMTVDQTSGVISWTPTGAQIGQHVVAVSATNSAGSDQQQFTIAVRQTVGVSHLQAASRYRLDPAYPNPMRSIAQTSVAYEVPASNPVRIELWNMLGERIAILVDRTHDAGLQTLTIRPRELPRPLIPGVYVITMQSGTIRQSRSVIVLP